MTTGDRIKAARNAAGLTQKELAQICGLATGTIQQYELNKRLPKNKEITEKLADALNVSGVYLIWGDESEFRETPLDKSKQLSAFLNYLDKLGYEFVDGSYYDAPLDEVGMIHLKSENLDIPLTSEEFDALENSIKDDISLEIYRLRKEKRI